MADRQGDWRQYSVHRRSDTRDKQETGGRRWDTGGDGRQAREGVKRQETGDMGKTGDRRSETEEVRQETML